ncbi:hypothetical protein M409DRAFT_59114 [Zasmidium cellare ATCC 36951]|uniref:Uncharacterized protein n=1 Tax=Zasmidium cellare ATCC 36951 TaxID=1080233 RepID=A0A6A6C324_ZASCE|nr:uncharacterized protein M409DRAFT_59114 [Zasmidium cellare ATCC 36951]KAF2161405.1 hypothetical protein M409DRAFT_59114 [Zasmidium cellare ATCC 36951]
MDFEDLPINSSSPSIQTIEPFPSHHPTTACPPSQQIYKLSKIPASIILLACEVISPNGRSKHPNNPINSRCNSASIYPPFQICVAHRQRTSSLKAASSQKYAIDVYQVRDRARDPGQRRRHVVRSDVDHIRRERIPESSDILIEDLASQPVLHDTLEHLRDLLRHVPITPEVDFGVSFQKVQKQGQAPERRGDEPAVFGVVVVDVDVHQAAHDARGELEDEVFGVFVGGVGVGHDEELGVELLDAGGGRDAASARLAAEGGEEVEAVVFVVDGVFDFAREAGAFSFADCARQGGGVDVDEGAEVAGDQSCLLDLGGCERLEDYELELGGQVD